MSKNNRWRGYIVRSIMCFISIFCTITHFIFIPHVSFYAPFGCPCIIFGIKSHHGSPFNNLKNFSSTYQSPLKQFEDQFAASGSRSSNSLSRASIFSSIYSFTFLKFQDCLLDFSFNCLAISYLCICIYLAFWQEVCEIQRFILCSAAFFPPFFFLGVNMRFFGLFFLFIYYSNSVFCS